MTAAQGFMASACPSCDRLSFDAKNKRRSGIAAEVSAEGNSEFARFNGTIRGFLLVLNVAAGGRGYLPSVYVGGLISVDFALGLNNALVPLCVRQTLGGRLVKNGLGHSVRGMDSGSLDTNIRAVSNLEVRARLPALLFPDLVRGLWDLGYYDQAGDGVAVPEAGG
jgi:hypothetical protein